MGDPEEVVHVVDIEEEEVGVVGVAIVDIEVGVE
jgi:hypothetical protein